MEIKKILVNHLEKPIGYDFKQILITALLTNGDYPNDLQKKLLIGRKQEIVFQTDWQPADDLDFHADFAMRARTRYHVVFSLKSGDHIWEKASYFETGMMTEKMSADWIGPVDKSLPSVRLSKTFSLPRGASQARLYVSGLGLYECYLDHNKIGREFLRPGFTNYGQFLQRDSYDLSESLSEAGLHTLSILLGDGWYRSKFGIKVHGGKKNQYGDQLMAIAEIHYIDAEGQDRIVQSDDSWSASSSTITQSGIYYGEDVDMNADRRDVALTTFSSPTQQFSDRLSLAIEEHEKFPVQSVIQTKKGDTVLDFGQNMAGWVLFTGKLAKKQRISLSFSELMQQGEFYRDNLRSARAEFTYVSDGIQREIRPHFTYFGFRYVLLQGFQEVKAEDFTAVALYSSMREIGSIETDRSDVNQLFSNISWGQKSNFLDIPTDCPQRDERLGWTGDAAIFAKTASYNMDSYAFFRKYAFDMLVEQKKHAGFLPLYAPAVDETDGGKAVWSDAATIIPWIMYERSGDNNILSQNFSGMKAWVDWIYARAEKQGNPFLWLKDDQLGDWLALDTEDIMGLKGKTPDELIASAYYFQSAYIVAQAALKLGYAAESDHYSRLAAEIKRNFLDEFFSKNGRLVTDTQTALAICLNFGLFPDDYRGKTVQALLDRLAKDRNHLTTGFVGTPQLLLALSRNGQHELAAQIFLNHDFPSWLYEVDLGATTVWERWNSLLPDGQVNDNGMNSMNHYSAGAVMQWAYEELVGIQQQGRHQLIIKPGITGKFKFVSGYTETADGQVSVNWQLCEDNPSRVRVEIQIPYGSQAKILLPAEKGWSINGRHYANGSQLLAGHYLIDLQADKPFIDAFNVQSPLSAFNQDEELTKQLAKLVPFWGFLTAPGNMAHFQAYSLYQLSSEMRGIGFPVLTKENMTEINNLFLKNAMKKINKESVS